MHIAHFQLCRCSSSLNSLGLTMLFMSELQKRANRANQLVLFFLADANFWEKHAKNTRKQAKTRENRRKTGAFLVLIFWGGKLVGANFYAFCNYVNT